MKTNAILASVVLFVAAGVFLGGTPIVNAALNDKSVGSQNQKDDGQKNQKDDGQQNQNDDGNQTPKKQENKNPNVKPKPEVAVLKRVNAPANLLPVAQKPQANNAQNKQPVVGKLQNIQKKEEEKKAVNDKNQNNDGENNQNDDGQKNQNDDGQKNQNDDGQVNQAVLKEVNLKDNKLVVVQNRQGKNVVKELALDNKVAVKVGNKVAALADLKPEMKVNIKMGKGKVIEVVDNTR